MEHAGRRPEEMPSRKAEGASGSDVFALEPTHADR